jgi:hypothetical protein
MFAKVYQSGENGVEIFSPAGSGDPLKIFQITNESMILREYDRGVKGNILIMENESATTKIMCPKSHPSLHITQPLLCFQLFLFEGKSFSLECSILDQNRQRKRLHFSSNFREKECSNPLHSKLPWPKKFQHLLFEGHWFTFILNLQELSQQCFTNSQYQALESFTIHPACKIRKIFSLPMSAVSGNVVTVSPAFEFPVGCERAQFLYNLQAVEQDRAISDKSHSAVKDLPTITGKKQPIHTLPTMAPEKEKVPQKFKISLKDPESKALGGTEIKLHLDSVPETKPLSLNKPLEKVVLEEKKYSIQEMVKEESKPPAADPVALPSVGSPVVKGPLRDLMMEDKDKLPPRSPYKEPRAKRHSRGDESLTFEQRLLEEINFRRSRSASFSSPSRDAGEGILPALSLSEAEAEKVIEDEIEKKTALVLDPSPMGRPMPSGSWKVEPTDRLPFSPPRSTRRIEQESDPTIPDSFPQITSPKANYLKEFERMTQQESVTEMERHEDISAVEHFLDQNNKEDSQSFSLLDRSIDNRNSILESPLHPLSPEKSFVAGEEEAHAIQTNELDVPRQPSPTEEHFPLPDLSQLRISSEKIGHPATNSSRSALSQSRNHLLSRDGRGSSRFDRDGEEEEEGFPLSARPKEEEITEDWTEQEEIYSHYEENFNSLLEENELLTLDEKFERKKKFCHFFQMLKNLEIDFLRNYGKTDYLELIGELSI